VDNSSVIMAVIIDQRNNTAPQVQEVLTKYGCLISTRLGLHQVRGCSDNGLIILHLAGSDTDIQRLEKELEGIDGVRVKMMNIDL
jgi:hypothetical protein